MLLKSEGTKEKKKMVEKHVPTPTKDLMGKLIENKRPKSLNFNLLFLLFSFLKHKTKALTFISIRSKSYKTNNSNKNENETETDL